jgi:uncharacterized protein (TIGR03000 family)
MLEVLKFFRANGYKTYIVTGGGQDFVRVYGNQVYGIPPEQVVGTAGVTKYAHNKSGTPFLMKEPKLLLNDNYAGKPEGIHLMIGQRPFAAFGNSTGDQQMLEYTTAGDGARLGMLVLHDDAEREYAYGPAKGLPDTKVGTFTQALDDEAKQRGWVVISMKNDWKRLFSFDPEVVPAQEGIKQAVKIEVFVPAGAQVAFDGSPTTETGEKRSYVSPPLAVDREYTYVLTVTWQGNVVTKELQVRPGKVNRVDLRADFGLASGK